MTSSELDDMGHYGILEYTQLPRKHTVTSFPR